jgi:orotate phosphoribosyltransferase
MAQYLARLEDIFYEMLSDYMSPENANQLCFLLVNQIKSHMRLQFIFGIAIGGLVTAILFLIRW